MTKFLSKGFHVRPAALLLMLLALSLLIAGCRSSGPDPRAFNTPPTNAHVLSGGKIKHFIPPPGLPNNRTDAAMLEACQQLKLNSDTARAAYAVFKAREGQFPVPILIVGDQTIASLGDVFRNHDTPLQPGSNGSVTLYPGSAASIILDPGKSFAIVGGTKVVLKNKALLLNSDKELLMSLPDMISVFHARDQKRGTRDEIQFVNIIYDVQDFYDRPRH